MTRYDTITNLRNSLLCQGFTEGKYQELISVTYDQPEAIDLRFIPSVVGALSFSGRVDEAESICKKYLQDMSETQRAMVDFFIVAGLTRKSNYERAQEWLSKLRLQQGDDLSAFYYYQAHSFFHYFQGQIKECRGFAEKALAAAIQAHDLYARSLATDLLGHLQVHTGLIQAGLQLLADASRLSKKLKNASVANAIDLSILKYRVMYGLELLEAIPKLENELRTIKTEDSYNLSLIGLELARQHTLRGQFYKTEEVLKKISNQILASRNIRYEISLNLRWAELSFQKGDMIQAMQFLRSAQRCLQIEGTESFATQVLGMEMKFIKFLSPEQSDAELTQRLLAVSDTYPSVINSNILSRRRLGSESFEEDFLHTIISTPQSPTHLELILKNQLLTLLMDALSIPRGQNTLYLDFQKNVFLLILPEGIFNLQGLSKLSFSILRQLTRGPQSKGQLCEAIWKYSYDPLRHDSMIYTAINHLRVSLDRGSHLIRTTENGYELPENLNFKLVESPSKSERKKKVEANVGEAVVLDDISPDLNWRQIKGLELFKKHEWVDVAIYMKALKTNKLMASRDLRWLTEHGLILRYGKGRATKYRRVNRP